MARTIRVFWRQQKSGWFNFNWNGVINEQSVIHISACEAFFPDNNLFGADGVTRGTEARHDLLPRNVEFLTGNNNAFSRRSSRRRGRRR